MGIELFYLNDDEAMTGGDGYQWLRQLNKHNVLVPVDVIYRSRLVAGQNDDGSFNGEDYTETRWVTPWVRENNNE